MHIPHSGIWFRDFWKKRCQQQFLNFVKVYEFKPGFFSECIKEKPCYSNTYINSLKMLKLILHLLDLIQVLAKLKIYIIKNYL